MADKIIPSLLENEISYHFALANSSIRRRSPKILHKKGDYLNKVINFVLFDSYMHPHLHPGSEKIEKMYLIKGSFALIIFDDKGNVKETVVLSKGEKEFVSVPAYAWHTYVMLTNEVIVYETMDGVYEPSSWKEMASWAPKENAVGASNYLEILKNNLVN